MSSKSPTSTVRIFPPPPDEETGPAELMRLVARELWEMPESEIAGEWAGRSTGITAHEFPEESKLEGHRNREPRGVVAGRRESGYALQIFNTTDFGSAD